MKPFVIAASIVLIFGFLPLVLASSAGNTRLTQIGFTNDITSIGLIDVLNQKLGSCYEIVPSQICRIVDNKVVTFSSVFFQNYLHHFSLDFLYLKGTSTQYSLLYERGLLYVYEVVFLIIGFTVVARQKAKGYLVVILLLSALPDAVSGGGHHSRASVMLPFILLFEAVGLAKILEFLQHVKIQTVRYGLQMVLLVLIIFSVSSFALTYFSYFKKNYSSFSLFPYKELSRVIYEKKNEYPNIYLSTYKNDAPQYIFFLFYNKYDPVSYQAKNKVTYEVGPNGFVLIKKIENINFTDFRFIDTFPAQYKNRPGLFIGSPDAFPDGLEPTFTVNDLTGGAVFEAVEYKEDE